MDKSAIKMFIADFLYVNYVYQKGNLLIVMLTKDN